MDRTVAIKVLPHALAADPQFRERFDREARTISQLNHPHICTLYDIGREGDIEYLVLEYLEGETLAERVAKGPLPLAEALEYGSQIADALDKAHRQGVIHRSPMWPIIRRCLARRPEDRCRSARELAASCGGEVVFPRPMALGLPPKEEQA